MDELKRGQHFARVGANFGLEKNHCDQHGSNRVAVSSKHANDEACRQTSTNKTLGRCKLYLSVFFNVYNVRLIVAFSDVYDCTQKCVCECLVLVLSETKPFWIV